MNKRVFIISAPTMINGLNSNESIGGNLIE
jgi:hypothetical protein